jgi:hypothetical protein
VKRPKILTGLDQKVGGIIFCKAKSSPLSSAPIAKFGINDLYFLRVLVENGYRTIENHTKAEFCDFDR